MNLAVATATFYALPFERALDIIKKAGFQYVELDIYWRGGDNWEMAQHIKGIHPREVLKMVRDSGLQISSLHDIGGVIEPGKPSFISPDTYTYLEYANGSIPCIVLHTPHTKTDDADWWQQYRHIAARDLLSIKGETLICIENMIPFKGYHVPLIQPQELLDFATRNDVYVNIDTTHYAECGIDIIGAAHILKERVKTIHLSDYGNGKRHAVPGEGSLDIPRFLTELPLDSLHAITLEYVISSEKFNLEEMIYTLRQAKDFVEQNCNSPEVCYVF